jgi:hypothetical protein
MCALAETVDRDRNFRSGTIFSELMVLGVTEKLSPQMTHPGATRKGASENGWRVKSEQLDHRSIASHEELPAGRETISPGCRTPHQSALQTTIVPPSKS